MRRLFVRVIANVCCEIREQLNVHFVDKIKHEVRALCSDVASIVCTLTG